MKRTMTLALPAIAAVSLLAFGVRTAWSGGTGRADEVTGAQTEVECDGQEPAAQRHNARRFSLATMKGTHGFIYSGTLTGSGPIASAGQIAFDGKGHLAADYNVTIDGTLYQGSFTGTYTVNPNGTGTVTLNLPLLGILSHGSFVIVNDGEETFFTSTDPGQTVTGVTKRT